ncbi:hypothetical protein GQR58_021449 [Nymphon striatum]|nr:hypothetical protein GQR58_021449 [Nymphon striatum]
MQLYLKFQLESTPGIPRMFLKQQCVRIISIKYSIWPHITSPDSSLRLPWIISTFTPKPRTEAMWMPQLILSISIQVVKRQLQDCVVRVPCDTKVKRKTIQMAEKFQPVSSDLTLKERKEARSLRSVDLSDAEIGNRRNALAHCLVLVKDLVEFAIPKGLEALNRCHSIYDIHWCKGRGWEFFEGLPRITDFILQGIQEISFVSLPHFISSFVWFIQSCLFFVCFCCPANVNIFGEIIFSASVDLACAITSNPSCLESTTSDEVKISPFAMLTNFSAATVGTNGFLIHSITHEEYFTKPRMAPCHLVIIFATHNLVGSSTATDSRSHNDLFDATFSHQELNKPQKVLNNMKPTKSQLLMSLTDLTLDSRRRSSQARFSQRLGLLEFVGTLDIISCGIHIASVLGFGMKVEIIQGSLKELSGDVMCWNDYVINRILNYFHVGNKIYETSIHSIGFGVKVEIIQSSLKELSGDDMCWNDYVSIM